MNMRWICSTMFVLGIGCDRSIKPEAEQPLETEEPVEAEDDTPPEAAGEIVELTIDASDMESWTFLDLDTQRVVAPEVAESTSDWDLSFKRFSIALNSTVSDGKGDDVQVAVLRDTELDDVDRIPTNDFARDGADGSDADEEPDYVMSTGESGWYDYNPEGHILSPRAHVYLIRTTQGAVFKLEIVDYYNDAGSSGHLALRFAQLQAGSNVSGEQRAVNGTQVDEDAGGGSMATHEEGE